MKDDSEIISFTIPVTRGEFALWNWAARQNHGRSLSQFATEAIHAALSETARGNAARGKPVPQFVAEALQARAKRPAEN